MKGRRGEMKKETIICDKCHKEFEEKTSIYATIFISSNGRVNDRSDICIDCWREIFNKSNDHPTEKGGK